MTKRTVFSRINNASRKDVILYRKYLEKYSSGRRGAPAKGIGRVDRREGSNPSFSALNQIKRFKKLLTKSDRHDKISELPRKNDNKEKIKKLLTMTCKHDKIYKLLEITTTNIDN